MNAPPPPLPEFRLELVRPGEMPGHVLSKLTRYIALCDGVDADTVTLPLDHAALRRRLVALRYRLSDDPGTKVVPNRWRRDALASLGHELRELLARLRGFQTRLAEATEPPNLAHLRLVLDGSELAQIPFEASLVPRGWRGAGDALVLSPKAPVTLTRELRASAGCPVAWDRRPRILFCTASPGDSKPPPAAAHLDAIRGAIGDWLDGATEDGKPLVECDVLTYLPDASLAAIQEAMEQRAYTHVHILCHGCKVPGDVEAFGLALAAADNPEQRAPATGGDLARALLAGAEAPTVVVLAACDSGNEADPLLGGASLAYQLHAARIPWVVASQFPLTFPGSVVLARELFGGLLAGRDPRHTLRRVRTILARGAARTHDWASIVVYAATPPDLAEQVRAYRIRQLRRRIESAFQRAPRLDGDPDREFDHVDRLLDQLASESTHPTAAPVERAELLGLRAAYTKRKARIRYLTGGPREAVDALLETALRQYREAAAASLGYHWVVVQSVSLAWVLDKPPLSDLATVAEVAADLAWHESDLVQRRWAAGSLLELALLAGRALRGRTAEQWAAELVRLTGQGDFERASTRRQVDRYVTWWLPAYHPDDSDRLSLAQRVLAVLEGRPAQAESAAAPAPMPAS